MTDFRINVVVDPGRAQTGARVVRRELRDTGRQAERLQRILARTFAFVGITSLVRETVELADSFTNLQNRLRVVTDGQRELEETTADLLGVANRSRSSFEATAELYTRVALATRSLGQENVDLLGITESVNKAIILSGASAKEANNGLIQLSQGIASNRLGGDELRSTLEQLPVVADIIAQELGVTRGELRELGAEGAITGEVVIQAFANAREEIEERFGQTIPTVAQSFQILRNEIINFVGATDRARGASATLSSLIIAAAGNVDILIRGLLTLVTVLGTQLAVQAVGAAIRGLASLGAALLANPITALPALLSLSVAALVGFGDQILVSADSAATLQDVAVASFEAIRVGINETLLVVEDLARPFLEQAGIIELTLSDVLLFLGTFADSFIGIAIGIGNTLVTVFTGQTLNNAIKESFIDLVNDIITFLELPIDAATAIVRTFQTVFVDLSQASNNFFSGLGQAAELALSGSIEAAGTVLDATTTQLSAALVRTARDIPGTLATEFDRSVDDELIPRIENSFEGSLQNFGETVRNGFLEGLAFDGVSGAIGGVLAAAQAAADARQRGLFSASQGGEGDTPGDRNAAGREREANAFATILGQIQQENALLALGNREREVTEAVLERIDALQKAGGVASPLQIGIITALEQENQVRREVNALVEDLTPLTDRLAERQRIANEAFQRGAITGEQYAQVLRDIALEQAEAGRSLEDGITRGVARVEETLGDLATPTENALVGAFQSAEDALVGFVDTGKISFRDLAQSIISDLARIASRALLGDLFGFLGGAEGIGGALSGLITPARNGTINAGANDPFLVGEAGPELFVPNTSGSILTNGATMDALLNSASAGQQQTIVNMPPPVVNVTVVNQMSNEAIQDAAFSGPKADQMIVNKIGENREAVNSNLA